MGAVDRLSALVIATVKLLRASDRPDASRGDPALLGFEKNSQLVTSGLYHTIRHPMYSSFLFIGWGIFFKSPSLPDFVLAMLCANFLHLAAHIEERENAAFFGAEAWTT